jgi:hypothetical protein
MYLGRKGLLSKRRGVANFPLLFEEGWLRDQENVAKLPKLAQTGW